MKKIFSSIVIASIISPLAFMPNRLIAGGCSSHIQKKVETECTKNEDKCSEINSKVSNNGVKS